MTEPPNDTLGPPGLRPPAAPAGPGTGAVLAWLAIIMTAAVILAAGALAGAGGPPPGAAVSMEVELAGKMLVAVGRAFPGYDAMILDQFDQSAQNELEAMCGAVVAGELRDPEAALERLDRIEAPDPETAELRDALRDLYGDLAAGRGSLPSLDEGRGAAIVDRLGWFGRLALHAPGVDDEAGRERLLEPLWRIPIVLVAVLCWFAFGAIAGTGALVALLVLALSGRLREAFALTGRGTVYAETFALWFAGFFGAQLALKWLAASGRVPPEITMPAGLAIFFASLLALAWPVRRGIPWPQVRRDIGLTWGRGAAAEGLAGWVAYVMSVPLLIVGVLVFAVLSAIVNRLFPGGAPPSHPVQETITGGSWTVIAGAFLLACVAAPVVEETMFRGVLYRHLREATGHMERWLSIAISALVSSFLFAVIHPQGWVFAPVLTGLAVAFCLAREWRGSLVSCMVAHGMTNALALCLNLALFRGV